MKQIYLAGPIRAEEDNGRTWRNIIKEDYGHMCDFIDPLDHYDRDEDDIQFVFDGDISSVPDGVTAVTPSMIVEKDKESIDKADGILVRWKEIPSCGTPMEVMYTHRKNQRIKKYPSFIRRYLGKKETRISVWTPLDTISPWMDYHANSVSKTPHEAIMALFAP